MTTTEGPIPLDPAQNHADARAELDDAVDLQAHSVLLIHGGQPSSSLIWTRVRPLLHACGLRELAIESPGCGQTTGAATDPFGNAAVIAAELDEQHTTPTIVVGHSLGAGMALALAATAPHHVRALVLVAPAAGVTAMTATHRALAARVVGSTLTWVGLRAVALARHLPVLRQRILTDRIGVTDTDTDVDGVVPHITHGAVWRGFIAEQRQLVTNTRLIDASLGAITCPVVIVAGTGDRVVRPGIVAALARQLPESNLITTDAGHLIPIDNPEAVVHAILRALRWQYRNSLRAPASRRA